MPGFSCAPTQGKPFFSHLVRGQEFEKEGEREGSEAAVSVPRCPPADGARCFAPPPAADLPARAAAGRAGNRKRRCRRRQTVAALRQDSRHRPEKKRSTATGIATAGRDRAAAAEAMPKGVPATAGQPLTSAVRGPVQDMDMAAAADRVEVRDTDRDVVKADMAAAKGRRDVRLPALRTVRSL